MNNATILVVDDNPTNLKLVSDVLGFDGFRVLQAGDAESAQEIIRATPPDLILMDIALPGMDGLTLTRLLKAGEMTGHIIIIALTAFAMKGDEGKARDAGCDGYITKPIDTRTLSGVVGGYLGGKRMKILVVEDQEIELKLAVHVLKAAGHEVTPAEAADEALAAIKADAPTVILLDLLLPGMDGLSLVRKLRADPATRDIPIVAITSNPERFPMADALAAGCDAYLGKPLSTRTLPDTLIDVVANADRRDR